MRISLLLTTCFLLLAANGFSQNPVLVKDIAPFPYGSAPGSFAVLGDKILFAGNVYNTSSSNRELFISDGTADGTQLLLDLDGTNSSSGPEKLIARNGKVYFTVADNSFGPLVYRAWVTDGTALGTFALLPNPTDALGYAMHLPGAIKAEDVFVEYQGEVYFAASKKTAPYDRVIYKTNGTQQGTTVAIELPNSSGIYNLINGPVVYNDSLYFSGTTAGGGTESLYKCAGTSASVSMVKSNLQLYYWQGTAVYNNKMYFNGNTFGPNSNGDEVWVTDGTEAGTVEIANLQTQATVGSTSAAFTWLNGKLLFLAMPESGLTMLYAIDSTLSSTPVVLDTVGTINITYNSASLFRFNNTVYFRGSDATYGYELWKSDGTAAGTRLVKDIQPGGNSNPHTFVKYCNAVYFTAQNPTTFSAQALYKTDGTEEGTVLIPGTTDAPTAGAAITAKVVFNDKLYFSGQYDVNLGEELYSYNAGCSITGVEDAGIEPAVTLYPNPTPGILHLQMNNAGDVSYSVYNTIGQVLTTGRLNHAANASIDISAVPEGVYFIRLQSHTGNSTYKVVKNL